MGGEFLVFEGQRREVRCCDIERKRHGAGHRRIRRHRFAAERRRPASCRACTSRRDEIVGGFLDRLDELAGTLAFEFNKVYSQGQGLVGFEQLTSVEAVDDVDAALDEAGLAFTPVSGTFDVVVSSKTNRSSRKRTRFSSISTAWMRTRRWRAWPRSSMRSTGLSASISSTGALQLSAESTDVEFAFCRRYERRAGGAGAQHVFHRLDGGVAGRERRTEGH